MRIEQIEIKPYRRGWMMRWPYEGRDKDKNVKIHYRETYYPTLKQTLLAALDNEAGLRTTTEELLSSWGDIEARVQSVLSSNGLV